MKNNDFPLIDLHRHLDGNIRPATIWQLAERSGIKLPADSLDDFIPLTLIQDKAANLLEFLTKLDYGVSVLSHVEDCYRVAYENMQDAHQAGLDYVELRFSPYYMSMNHQLNMPEVVEAVAAGVATGARDYNLNANLIGILSRTFGVEKCMQELDALLNSKQKLVGIDLAGDEAGYPAKLFVPHFNKVHKADLNVTIHAGEADGAKSVWDSIQLLGARRIGHGCAAVNDPELMAYMASNNIAIESCLNSNYQTGTVKSLSDHPVKTFLQQGIKVCLNTDDPAVENIEIRDEYQVASEQLKLSDEQLILLQKNAIDMAFLSTQEKTSLLQKRTCHLDSPLKIV